MDDCQGLLHGTPLVGLGFEIAGNFLNRIGAFGEFGKKRTVKAETVEERKMIVSAGDTKSLGDQGLVAGGGSHPEDIVVAVDIIDHVAIVGGGEDAKDFIGLWTSIKDIPQNLNAVEKHLADGVGEMGD